MKKLLFFLFCILFTSYALACTWGMTCPSGYHTCADACCSDTQDASEPCVFS